MTGKIVLRIVSALVLVAAIAGIAFFAYQAGVAQGSPISIQAPAGETSPAPYPLYGYGMPWHPFFPFVGLGCFGPLIVLFLFFIALRALGFLFWGPGRWGHMHGHWRHHGWGEEGVPPMFKEWHDRAHGKAEPETRDE